jgi:hypothetical protein
LKSLVDLEPDLAAVAPHIFAKNKYKKWVQNMVQSKTAGPAPILGRQTLQFWELPSLPTVFAPYLPAKTGDTNIRAGQGPAVSVYVSMLVPAVLHNSSG